MKKLWSFSLVVIFFCAFIGNAQAVKFVEVANGSFAESGEGDVIVFTKGGKPILPDLEKGRAKKPPRLGNEISFTFNSPNYPWTSEEIATMQQWVKDLYPVMKAVYGSPAFSITVNIRKDPTISGAGYYYPGTNEAVIRNLYIDVFCHEVIHAFHDDLFIYRDIYEEGMTRAAEVAVLSYLPQYEHPWNAHHSYGTDTFHELNNQPEIAAFAGQFGSGFINMLLRYQLAGYAWAKPYIEDRTFFKRFNSRYYDAALADSDVQLDVERLKAIAERTKRTVENRKFAVWYQKQHIFNIEPEYGYQIVYKQDTEVDNGLYVFDRVGPWEETMLADVTVSWEMFSCQGEPLASGSALTNANGWVVIPLAKLTYEGKLRIDITVSLPDATIRKSIVTVKAATQGIFGVTNACEGRVHARGERTKRSASVVNGAFSFPELKDAAGTFTINYGRTRKTVTKDAAAYFVHVE